ncbi:MAG: DUF2130 domain-containing protein [Methanothrix sp.]|nr:DUF2130 domain-containing protein [Methanothrix sp.]
MLGEGITRQTIERYEQDFETALKERESGLRQELEKAAERKLTKDYTAQLEDLKEQLTGSQQALTEMKSRIEKVQKETKAKALADFELEKKLLQQELSEKDGKLKELRDQELALRQEKTKLEEFRREMELELQRKIDEERTKIEEQIRNSEGERFKLKEAEYQKKIEDAQKANEDLRRKLEQGSQQLQGEVLELELENILKNAFPFDMIEAVRKGARGADMLQTVITRTGQDCGKIIWEAKRAENWSNAWVQKLKDDQREANAELAVLVTTVMPKQIIEPFCIVDEVWVVNSVAVRPMAETLRLMLIETNKNKLIGINKNEKMEALYHYLCSPQFVQKVRAVVDAFTSMKCDLDSEKAAMARIWKKRDQQIQRVTLNMMGMCGELQAIAQESLPQLDSIATLPAPDTEVEAAAEMET